MKLIRLIWGGVIFTTALAGCQNEDIYLAEDINTVKYNQAFRDMFGEIDPNQDFNMATLLKANIQVNFGTGKEYTVKFYTDNPRVNKDDTYLLGKFTVKDGVAQEVQLDVPEYMQKKVTDIPEEAVMRTRATISTTMKHPNWVTDTNGITPTFR